VIVDSSALVAIAVGEPASGALVVALAAAANPAIGAPTAAEAALVLEHRFPGRGQEILRGLLSRFGVTVLPFPPDLWALAHTAFTRFGRGRHPAALNFGDCLCYAVCRAADQPLLYVGADFSMTDLRAVRY
jgi:ribonuclease VapC